MLEGLYTTFAVCPICTLTVGAGLAISQQLGIDDLVTSVWIGGLLASISVWTINWFKQKNKTFKYYQATIYASYYILTFLGLYWAKSLFRADNTIIGIDKIIAGTAVGTAVFISASQLYQYLKAKNGGKAHFPFEKIAIPVVSLLVISLVFWLITK